ncbi:hypothetical protein E4534_25820, partial [Escherichia coli]|uniref:hypothetical protein n=1 Tax=Escherichia coli TaxID=562 RepID=UPI001FAA91F2
PLTDLGGKTSIFSHPVYLFLREFSLQDFRGGSVQEERRILMTIYITELITGLLVIAGLFILGRVNRG